MITFDHCDHWVRLPRSGAYPLVVSPVVSQVRLAKVLVDGGSALNIIFSSTLESMGYDMTSLVPSDQAFYGIIPGAGSTSVGRVTLPVTFGTRETIAPSMSTSRSPSSRPPTTQSLGDHLSPNSWPSPTTPIFS
jgi:hypothetical protein